MLSFPLFCALLVGVMLDHWLGEPRSWHPLVGFGRLAMAVEKRLNRQGGVSAGALAVVITVVPWVLAAVVLLQVLPGWAGWGLQALGLWLVIGGRSLEEHGQTVIVPLRRGDLLTARQQVGRMVSRDTVDLDNEGVARAATESVLENGADALFASLFWFALAGLPGALLHRLVNTLDAMWGYRTDRFERFGKVAARLDDLLGWAPARLTAISYALCGRFAAGLRCWQQQAGACDSPNAGPVMAAGAGALAVLLGGGAPYHGGWKDKPCLGEGKMASADSIAAAIALMQRALALWLVVLLGASL
ncbi:MAG: adenosylcobinamide-phosphate synthase CbiB [Alcanivorax sp.]|uniref:adenosylcobinamide-phosphate synthase CbiB n=1 Tax=Alcanivorax sp. TaxID=1872427 RepID=UPI003DA788D1